MSTISASTTTTTAYSVTADTTGTLVLQTGATPTTAVTIDTSQNVGVGVTPNAGWATSTGKVIDLTGNSSLYGFSSGGTYSTMLGSNSYYDATNWRAKVTGTSSLIQLTAGNFALQMANSASAGAPLTYTAVLTNQGVGQTLVLQGGTSTSGTGIAFPATQSTSTDANTLDDYEEGTFTPNQGAGLTVVGTFSSSGSYTKVGRLVTVIGLVTGSTSVASSAGAAICSNLPFTSASGAVGGAADSNGGGGSCLVNSVSVLSYPARPASPGIYFTVTYIV
jgi:hypothetical protein